MGQASLPEDPVPHRHGRKDPRRWLGGVVGLFGPLRGSALRKSGAQAPTLDPLCFEVRLILPAVQLLDQEVAWREFSFIGGSQMGNIHRQLDGLGRLLVLPVH